MSSIYRAIFRQAFNIMWRNKYLWFFGLFAALISTASEINLLSDNFTSVTDSGSSVEILRQVYSQGLFENVWFNLEKLFFSFSWAGWLLLAVVVFLSVFLLWLVIVSQGALYSSAYKIFKKQKTDFSVALNIGRDNFWKVLWLNILNKLFLTLVLIVFGLPLLFLFIKQGGETSKSLIVVLFFIIYLPLALIVSFVIKYAILYAVSRKDKLSAALKNAWHLFKNNWLVSIEMAILIFFLSIILVLIMLMVIGAVSIPLSLLVVILAGMKLANLVYLMFVISFLIIFLIVLLIGSMWSTFYHVAWSILFIRISEGNVLSKLTRIFSKQQTIKE